MPTPTKGYWLNGKRVPSVSTILGNLGWGNDMLLNWAVKITKEGGTHTQVRDDAADTGTCAHAMIEAFLTGVKFDQSPFLLSTIVAAQKPFRSFVNWHEVNPMKVIASEAQLVSSAHRYGGTFDFLVRMGREVVLIDIKTSNWIYPKHVLQVVAYMDLVEECMGTHVDRGLIVRVGKDGACETLPIEGETITQGREAFYHLLQLHKLKSPLEAATKAVNKPGAVPKSAELTIMGKAVA